MMIVIRKQTKGAKLEVVGAKDPFAPHQLRQCPHEVSG